LKFKFFSLNKSETQVHLLVLLFKAKLIFFCSGNIRFRIRTVLTIIFATVAALQMIGLGKDEKSFVIDIIVFAFF
jgi:hypothetical protein